MSPFADVSTDVKAGLEVVLSAFSSRCRTEFGVHLNQPSERVSLHLLHHFAPVRFYGNHADAEFVSDLFIQ